MKYPVLSCGVFFATACIAQVSSGPHRMDDLVPHLGAAGLQAPSTATGQDFVVHWDTTAPPPAAGGAQAGAQSGTPSRLIGSFRSLQRRRGQGSMPRPRSLELSSMQILVIGVNAAGKVVSWSTLPDPRILRAESERPDGTLAGQIVERTATDFLVPLHDDGSITTIRIYHPEWTGGSFRLDLVGSITLP